MKGLGVGDWVLVWVLVGLFGGIGEGDWGFGGLEGERGGWRGGFCREGILEGILFIEREGCNRVVMGKRKMGL